MLVGYGDLMFQKTKVKGAGLRVNPKDAPKTWHCT